MTPTATAPAKAPSNGKADWPYRFEVLPIKHLFVDGDYQRPLTTFVEKIEKKFDPALVGTLVTSERTKTKFAVVDGQTRMEAMTRRGLSHAPCLVYEGLTPADEADLFSRLQTERRGMASVSRFRAQVMAKDPFAIEVKETTERAGFTIDFMGKMPNAIPAVSALETVYRGMRSANAKPPYDPELLIETLGIIKAAWPKLPDESRGANMIRGLGLFLIENDHIDQDRLTRQLGKVQPSELGRRADQLREGRGMTGKSPGYMAEAIMAQYRKR